MAKKKAKKKAKKRKPAKKPGRKTDYSAACARKALKIMTEEPDLNKLAEALNVSLMTVYRWMQDHVPFKKAVEDGRARFADKVEASFLQLAVPHDEVTTIEGDEKDETRTKKNVVSVRAAERVLKAFKPDKYGDKLDVKVPLAINLNITKKYHGSEE